MCVTTLRRWKRVWGTPIQCCISFFEHFFFRLTPMWPRLLSTGEHTVPGEGILSTRTHAHTPTQVQTWKSLFRTFWNTSLCIARIGACLLLKKKKNSDHTLFSAVLEICFGKRNEWTQKQAWRVECWQDHDVRVSGKHCYCHSPGETQLREEHIEM